MVLIPGGPGAAVEPPERTLIVPLVTENHACLPLSINAVAKYWNIDLPVREAEEACKKYGGVKGSILMEGIELAERHGMRAAVAHSDIPGLKRLIDAGIPPILILPGMGDVVQHASVISGYNEAEGRILHYVPEPARDDQFKVGAIPEARFDEMWSEDGRLLITLVPPAAAELVGDADPAASRSNRLCFEAEKHNVLGQAGEAMALLEEALRLDPGNSTAHAIMGSVRNDAGSPDCVGHYESCIRLNPRSFLARRGLGNYYIKSKMYAEAERWYSEAIGINPSRYVPLYKNRAIAREQLGLRAQAKADLAEYLRLMPDAPDAGPIRRTMEEL